MKLACVVEGDGEVQALPVLLRRLCEWRTPRANVEILRPIRVRRDRFLKRDDERARMMALASAKAEPNGAILVLLGADDDCPAELGPDLDVTLSRLAIGVSVATVLANREFEAWFVATPSSIDGVRGFAWDGITLPDPEAPRDAKGWIRDRCGRRSYSPVSDQAAFAGRFDLATAHSRSRSFRQLVSAWDRLVPR